MPARYIATLTATERQEITGFEQVSSWREYTAIREWELSPPRFHGNILASPKDFPMTLLIMGLNSKMALLCADSRLSAGGRPADNNSPKVTQMNLDNATLLFGYTGLAGAGRFQTSIWIAQTISEKLRSSMTVEHADH